MHQNSSAQLGALNMDKKVSFGQQSTKVKQLSDIIEQDIMMGKYKTDTSLPSINYLSRAYNVSRDTVFKAFSDLRERKLIDSTPGKGYYVTNRQEKIFLLLDEYSPFKNTLYNSFVRKLSTSYCLTNILLSRIRFIIVS